MLVPEGADFVGVEGEDGRRHQLPEAQHEQLFRGVAHRGRVVDDERPILGQQLQQVRRGDVGHVERRVLAHQDHVDAFEVELLVVAEYVVGALPAEHFELAALGVEPAVAQGQRLRQVMIQRVAAPLRLERQRKGRIRVDVDRVDRVHLDRDGETHVFFGLFVPAPRFARTQARTAAVWRAAYLIVILLPGPSKPNSGISASRATAMQPSVPA